MATLERVERHGKVERFHMARTLRGKPLYWTSLYYSEGVLIDSGCARGRDSVQRFLSQRRVDAALTTHEHEDHVGNHALLEGVEVYAPQRSIDILNEGPPRLPFYRWLAWGSHTKAPGIAKRVHDKVETSKGRRFQVLDAPGHSADHVVYLDDDASAVYTGDAYFGKLRTVRAKENVPLQMKSLRKIAALDPDVLYPAHGAILPRPREKLLEVAEHFDALRLKAQRLNEKGLTPRRIRQEIFGSEPWMTYYSMGAFSAENLVKSLLRSAA